jgi:hypothetical protein
VGGGASRERKTALEAKSQGPVYPRERPIGGKDSRAQYLEDDSVPPPANAKQRAEQRKQAEGAKPLKRTPRTEARVVLLSCITVVRGCLNNHASCLGIQRQR